MINAILNAMFGCSHKRTTFPITPARNSKSARKGTYVCCLDCGEEFDYNWKEMRVDTNAPDHVHAGSLSVVR